MAESDIGSEIGIIKHTPPGTPRASVVSSLPSYSSRHPSAAPSRPPSYASGNWDSGSQAGPSRIPSNSSAPSMELDVNGYPVDKKEKISTFKLSQWPVVEDSIDEIPDTMTALSAERFRMHDSNFIFSDERTCATCDSPLVYGDDGKVSSSKMNTRLSC